MRLTEEKRVISPLKLASIASAAYIVVAGIYIWLSSKVAAQEAASLIELAHYEIVKGLLFVLTTGIAIFLVGLHLFRKIARREEELLRQKSALLTSERRALAGMYAASIAHDINNIIAIIDSAVSLLKLRSSVAEKDAGVLDILNHAVDRGSALTKSLMHVGREGIPGEIAPIDLTVVVTRAVELAKQHARVRDCIISIEQADRFPFSGNGNAIEQMLLNLIFNAADATSGRGKIELVLKGSEDEAVIEVHDDGPGVPPAQRSEIFRAFYSTKEEGRGLGLVTVKACAELHNGTIEVLDSPLGGACFRVRLRGRRREGQS